VLLPFVGKVILVGFMIFILIIVIVILGIVDAEDVEQTVRSSYEVGVVGVDVSILDFNEVGDHFGGGSQALVQHTLHYVADFGLESVVPAQLRDLNFYHDLP
jgi:hypothetical protein